MKAAVLHQLGEAPTYEEFPDPTPGEGEVLIKVRAVALENVDKAMAAGDHFASQQFLATLPAIPGFDGIGELADGHLVGFGGTQAPYGAMAEMTKVPEANTVPAPEGIDAVSLAAMPAAALTSLFPLKIGADLQPGQSVLVNGATGVAGKLAVQIARLLGAGRVVGSGRNPASLQRVRELGADAVIDLKQTDAEVAAAFEAEAGEGFDVVLDFVWGHPSEIMIGALVPTELGLGGKPTRWVQIGEMAGERIWLAAAALRTTGLKLVGAADGLKPERIGETVEQVYEWMREGKLTMDIEQVPLKDIESVWARNDFQGKRVVIVP